MKTPDKANINIALAYLEQANEIIAKIRKEPECSEPFEQGLELIAARIDSALDVLKYGY